MPQSGSDMTILEGITATLNKAKVFSLPHLVLPNRTGKKSKSKLENKLLSLMG